MVTKCDVFLLAAGEANRMYPLNQIIEKSLLPVDGKPVIRIIVDNIYKQLKHKQLSIRLGKIYICCLDKYAKNFQHEFRDMERDIKIIPFDNPVGTFSTFFRASLGEKNTEWVMVHYADCITEINYRDFAYILCKKPKPDYDGIIAVTNMVKHDYSEVSFQPDDRVTNFYEKPKISSHTWSGIGLFHKDNLTLNYKRKGIDDDFAFDIFPQMIAKKKLAVYEYNGFWADMGNLNAYRKICEKYQK